MENPGFCLNCLLSPTTFGLKLLGIEIMHTCQIDFTQSKLYKAYKCTVMICAWIAVIWSIHVSLTDKNTCIERCGGFVYGIQDNETSINLSKMITVGAISVYSICVTGLFFSKKVKIQSRQENFEGEIAYLTKIRNWVNLAICLLASIVSFLITLLITISLNARKEIMPKNNAKYIICQVIYQIMLLWCSITLCYVAGIVTINILFMRCRFKNIWMRFKNCEKNPVLMKEVLHVEEFKYAEMCDIVEKLDNAYGNILTIVVLCCILAETGFVYYGMFATSYARTAFVALGFVFASFTIGECLFFAEIQDYATSPIQELYVFDLYPMEMLDLIKVITFMKKINGKDFGLHYFGTVVYSREFALEMLNSVWSYLSTLREFRDITEENYRSTICNKTINIIETIT